MRSANTYLAPCFVQRPNNLLGFGLLQDDFADEQNLVAQMLHLFRGPDIEQMFGMLITIRKAFATGGPRRRVWTHPPLFFSALRLVQVMLKNAEAVRCLTNARQKYN